jgi:hypothetical protein
MQNLLLDDQRLLVCCVAKDDGLNPAHSRDIWLRASELIRFRVIPLPCLKRTPKGGNPVSEDTKYIIGRM